MEENGPATINETTFPVLSSNTTDGSLHWQCVEYKLQETEINQIQTFSFWIEGVCQFILGAIGILSNLLALPILCHKRMNTIFSKLLLCLLILHTVYLACVLLIELMWPAWDDNPQRISESWFIFIFSYGLYPLKQLMRFSSTFFTTLMARQRFLAIRHPIQYRNSTLTINPWVSVMKSLFLVIFVGAFFTFPVYLETSVKNVEVERIEQFNSTHFKLVCINLIKNYKTKVTKYTCFAIEPHLFFNQKEVKKEPTLVLNPIRLNWHYVIWYKNFTVLLVSLILPLTLLAYWNFNTLAVMARRRRLRNRPTLAIAESNYDAMAAELLNVDNISPTVGARLTSRQGTLGQLFNKV